jgi:hypothetical protein
MRSTFVHIGWIAVDIPILERRIFRTGHNGRFRAGDAGYLPIGLGFGELAFRVLFRIAR